MTDKQTFIVGRAEASRNAQEQILPEWAWPELSIVQWDKKIANFRAQDEIVADKEAAMRSVRGEVEGQLKLLHDLTGQGLAMARQKYRHDTKKLACIHGLTVSGNSRAAIMDEARDWEAAWEELDLTWAPVPENTITNFKTVRAESESLLKALAKARTVLKVEVEKLDSLGEELDDFNTAWYADATRVFKEGSPQGDMIRATVPTTSNNTLLPEKVIITLAESQESGSAALNYESEHATSFDILHKGPGATVFTKVKENTTEEQFVHANIALGFHQYKIVGRNSTGVGPESDVAGVTVQ